MARSTANESARLAKNPQLQHTASHPEHIAGNGQPTANLFIEVDFEEGSEGRSLAPLRVAVNGHELLVKGRKLGTLNSLILALLRRKLGASFLHVKDDGFAKCLLEAIKRQSARIEWVGVLADHDLLDKIISKQGTQRVNLNAPPECIRIRRNGVETTETAELRSLFGRLSGLGDVETGVETIEKCAEVLNNQKRTETAVRMLNDARTIEGLTNEDALSLACAYAKHLGHLEQHDLAFEVLSRELMLQEAAARGDSPGPNINLLPGAKPLIWYINPSVVPDNRVFDSYCLVIMRCLYHIGIVFRRKKLLDLAREQFKHILSFEPELSREGKGLLRMTKHQKFGVYEAELNIRHNSNNIFELVARGIVPDEVDDAHLTELQALAREWELQRPCDHQRCGFTLRRLGLFEHFHRNRRAALRNLDKALMYFDKAFDLRNLEVASDMRDRVFKSASAPKRQAKSITHA